MIYTAQTGTVVMHKESLNKDRTAN